MSLRSSGLRLLIRLTSWSTCSRATVNARPRRHAACVSRNGTQGQR